MTKSISAVDSLQSRLLFTLAAIATYRLALHIAVPGVN